MGKIDLKEKKYLVGIDPGFNNLGIAIYEPKTNLLELFGGDWFTGVDWLGKSVKLSDCVVVLENPALDSATFKALGVVAPVLKKWGNYQKQVGKGTWPIPTIVEWPEVTSMLSRSFMIAGKIGENKAAGKLMKTLLARHRVPTIEIPPSNRHNAEKRKMDPNLLVMPTKLNRLQFDKLTGYQGRSNEHGRDAATLVWGKSFKWAELQVDIGVQDNAKKTRQKSKEKRKRTAAVPKEDRKFFNVVDANNPGQRVTKDVNGKFVFVE